MPGFSAGREKTPYQYRADAGDDLVAQTVGYALFVALNHVPQQKEESPDGMLKRYRFQKRLVSALENDGVLEVSPSEIAYLSEKVKTTLRDPWMIGQVVEALGDSLDSSE